MTGKKTALDMKFDEQVYHALPLEEQLEKLIEIWGGDSQLFKKIDEEIDLEDEVFDMLNKLEEKRLMREIERLDAALRHQADQYRVLGKYVSQTLIPLYLAEDRENSKEKKSRIEHYLKPYYEYPTESTEIYFDLLNKLICYDQTSLAVDFCKAVYDELANSDKFFGNPSDTIANIILADIFQGVYSDIKKNVSVDWSALETKINSFGFSFTQDDLKIVEKVMLGQSNSSELANSFKSHTNLVLYELRLMFCCVMYDLDETSFVRSDNFASKVFSYLHSIPGREKCLLHVFFKIKEDLLMPHLVKLAEGWFDQTHELFAFMAGLPLFYLVLLKKGILDMKIVETALVQIIPFKSELKKTYSDKPWIYNFIGKLEAQASILASSESL